MKPIRADTVLAMFSDHVRDAAMTAVIFGFFATVWFGWAQENPPPSWRRLLVAGTAIAGLTAAGGLARALLHWSDGTVFDDATGRAFGIVVGVEFAAAAIGAGVLAATGRARWTPVWIAFVVGVHLFPVAVILEYPAIHVVAALVTAASLVAIPVARARSLTPSAVVGAGSGASLTLGAVFSLVAALVVS